MVTDRTNIAIANKYEVTYEFSIGTFTFDILALSKCQGQDHAHFDSESYPAIGFAVSAFIYIVY